MHERVSSMKLFCQLVPRQLISRNIMLGHECTTFLVLEQKCYEKFPIIK